jgi:DNA-binding XRE family transcriptional regulator
MAETTRHYRRAKGLCPGCGRIRERVGWVYCQRCRDGFARYYATGRSAKAPRSLGDRVRQHRASLGYTQSAYGSMLGITGDYVSGLEHGTWPSRPSRALQERLAEVLGCAIADLGLS